MHRKSTRRSALPSTCAICGGPLDYPSGFVFVAEPGRVVHPSCQMYELEIGPVPFGKSVHRTCGDVNCVNPAHLVLR